MRKSWSKWLTAGAVGLSLGVGSVGDANACGGFFCSRTPVDQTAERIIFTINDDTTVTAYIQVTYAGDKDNFAWVVPVPGAVEPGLFPQRALSALDIATEPTYSTNYCAYPELQFAGGVTASGGAASAVTDPSEPVVIQEQQFGPYQSVTLTGTDAGKLVAWLQDNGYRITDSMIPYIEKYVDDGMAFFAMRLLPEADILDISPVVLTYAGSEPMIPIRLTTVATQPEMGIVAWVLADQKYGPKNYADLSIADELIEFDTNSYGGRNNYLTVVSKQVDLRGGQAMVTEYAAPTDPLATTIAESSVPTFIEGAQEAQDELVALLRTRKYITRMYTRMSAEEMTEDPYFAPATDTEDVPNEHFLQCDEGTSISCACDDGSMGVRQCGMPDFGWYAGCECGTPEPEPMASGGSDAGGASSGGAASGGSGGTIPSGAVPIGGGQCGVQPPSPCTFTYCGRFGSCVANAAAAAVCVCDTDTTARARTTTAGELQLYCEPLVFNFMTDPPVETMDPDAGPGFVDPCADFDCGDHGTCATMNGSPTCRCESGYGATVTSEYDGTTATFRPIITCEAVQGIVPSLPLVPAIGETTVDNTMLPRIPGGVTMSIGGGGAVSPGDVSSMMTGSQGGSGSSTVMTTDPTTVTTGPTGTVMDPTTPGSTVTTPDSGAGAAESGGCSISTRGNSSRTPAGLALAAVALVAAGRGRRVRRGRSRNALLETLGVNDEGC